MEGPEITEYEDIVYEIADNILTITLNRPDRLNAFGARTPYELLHAFRAADDDDAVRVVIVTGAGKGFSAGADLDPDGTFDFKVAPEDYRETGGELALTIFNLKKPVIAAINGPAVGIGLSFTLPMDIRLASEKAKFGFVFARLGLTAEAGSTWFLPRIVGMSWALNWMISGRVIGAAEAKEGGLVTEVLPPEQLLPRAYAIAKEIATSTAPVAVALIRQMLWHNVGLDHPIKANRVESRALYDRGKTRDADEGVKAFLEKRVPRFPLSVNTDMPSFFPWWEEPPFFVKK